MENNSTIFSNNILVTGNPGVGKTSLSILLADELSNKLNKEYKYINIGELIHNHKLYETWNKEFDVPEFDEEKVISKLEEMGIVNGGFIIDFHSGSFFPEEWFALVVLLRCNNTELYDRLNARGYSQNKIIENIQCEIMEITADELKESYDMKRILELRNEKTEEMQKNICLIIDEFIKLKE
jgi:adenylate kinase